MWGCFWESLIVRCKVAVFPTHVGVFLMFFDIVDSNGCLPHACGGVSLIIISSTISKKSSPRMWGCFRSAGRVDE